MQGRWRADLAWTPAGTSATVDVYLDGNVVDTTQNDGSYTDATNNWGGTAVSSTFFICESRIRSFGPGFREDEDWKPHSGFMDICGTCSAKVITFQECIP
ncbi:MAG: hypothetical protein EA363_02070 [Balneolaceae bacterium]|nr:MAG: hypothetical protein EA363_02070 [Balneolaceae bacterium]